MKAVGAQVQAIRATAVALVVQCDAVLADLAADAPAPAPAAAGEGCPHPAEQRTAAPRMGAPAAWVCLGCGVEGGT